MIIIQENITRAWTQAVSWGDWAILSNTLAAHSLMAAIRGDKAIEYVFRRMSDRARQRSLDAYDDAWIEMETQMKSEAA